MHHVGAAVHARVLVVMRVVVRAAETQGERLSIQIYTRTHSGFSGARLAGGWRYIVSNIQLSLYFAVR